LQRNFPVPSNHHANVLCIVSLTACVAGVEPNGPPAAPPDEQGGASLAVYGSGTKKALHDTDLKDMNTTTKLLSPVFAVFFLCLGLAGQSARAVLIHDEPSGFQGVPWGASPADCAALSFVKTLGTTDSMKKVDLYDHPTDSVTLNGATFTRIRYRFLDNRLESVQLRYEWRANRNKLMQWVEQRYGALTPGERKQVGAEWEGEETVVNLSYNLDTGRGSLWLISRTLSGGFGSYNATLGS
jgi:hypothetical protein